MHSLGNDLRNFRKIFDRGKEEYKREQSGDSEKEISNGGESDHFL